MHIVLVGLPGSGKSTVGKQLAKRLSLPFVDSDHVIEQHLSCSIRTFFEREGEESFRNVEQMVLDRLTKGESCVLSTGGGSVLRFVNRQNLRQGGWVVYLWSTPEEVFRRLRYDKSRPLLQVANPLTYLRKLYVERDPLYRETAHVVIKTGRPSVVTLVDTIVMQLQLMGYVPSVGLLPNLSSPPR